MTKKRACDQCGYVSKEKNEKICPICGGTITSGYEPVCNEEKENEWNNGYHNDFEEGRKTGEYCDKKMEEYTNGGEHFHQNSKPSNMNDLQVSIDTKTLLFVLLISAMASPIIGIILFFVYRSFYKKGRLIKIGETEWKKIRNAFIAALIIRYVISVLFTFIN